MLDHEAAVKCTAKLNEHGYLLSYDDDQKTKASSYVFAELHAYAAQRLPFGCDAKKAEQVLKKGLKHVRNNANRNQQQVEQAAGVPILLILGLIPTLYAWIKMLIDWWRGE